MAFFCPFHTFLTILTYYRKPYQVATTSTSRPIDPLTILHYVFVFTMNRFTIVLSLMLCAQATALMAQKIHFLDTRGTTAQTVTNPETACDNNAGTVKLGRIAAKSNDIALDTMFLCGGDSVFLDHNGDQILTGDPVPNTPAGIVYGIYKCKPTKAGETLASIMTDPCLALINNSLVVASGSPSGDMWVTNDGSLQSLFNSGAPVWAHLAPMTIDNFATLSYESSQPGFAPGPCVNVNTSKSIAIALLNPIRENGLEIGYSNNDCLVRTKIVGGYPQTVSNAIYSLDMSLEGNTGVKALPMAPQDKIRHNAIVTFSVSQPGKYILSAKDGKSCDFQIPVNVSGCDASDNVVMRVGSANTSVGGSVCVPVTVKNFNLISTSFSVQWDPKVLKYKEIKQIHPGISSAFDPGLLNTDKASAGYLGVALLSTSSTSLLQVPNDEVLFTICFDAVGADGSCTAVQVNNAITPVSVERLEGPLALSPIEGKVCVGTVAAREAFVVEKALFSPNPVKQGQPLNMRLTAKQTADGTLVVLNAQGQTLLTQSVRLNPGDNTLNLATDTLAPGLYQALLDTGRSGQVWRFVVASK